MNVTELIAKAATHASWHCQVFDHGSHLSGFYTKDDQMLCVRYRLFGSTGGRRLCRHHGIDDDRWINWGIENAHVKTCSDKPPAAIWLTAKVFDGAKKKQQVLTYLREN